MLQAGFLAPALGLAHCFVTAGEKPPEASGLGREDIRNDESALDSTISTCWIRYPEGQVNSSQGDLSKQGNREGHELNVTSV